MLLSLVPGAFRHRWMAAVDTPGAGITLPIRNTTMIPSVNSSFLRRSGVRNALAKAVSTTPPAVRRSVADGRPGWWGRAVEATVTVAHARPTGDRRTADPGGHVGAAVEAPLVRGDPWADRSSPGPAVVGPAGRRATARWRSPRQR